MEYRVKGQIRGHVQGVGYRFFIQQLAIKYNVKGWAKNLEDGSVELLLQGRREDVNELQHEASRGPALADVRSLNWEIASDPEQHAFVIG